MTIDVLFINPSNQKKTYQDLSREFTAIATPVWATLIATYLQNKGYSVAIYDVNIEGWDKDEPKRLLSHYEPDLVVMMVCGHNPSASTQTMPAASKIANDIKNYNKDVPIIMGGIHPSALPEKTLKDENVDYVVQGEGPYTINGLIRAIKGKDNIDNAKGLWYKNKGIIKFTSPAPIIENLDEELTGYAWGLLPALDKYRAHNMHCFQDFENSLMDDFSDIRSPYVSMNTSLGCPYTCHYCCINAIFEKPRIRYWSLDKVLLWIDTLVNEYGVKNIRFDDELFILSAKRVEDFCDLVIERNYDLNIWVYGRVDTIKGHLLKKMKKAGINWICLGIESGNEKVRKNVNKSIKRDVKDIVEKIQSNDIYVLGNYMFGLPEDNFETMEETLQLAIDLNCEFANFYNVMAYPGSELYKSVSKGEYPFLENWECFSQLSYETRPLPSKYLLPEEVLKFRDEAFYRYYHNSVYMDMIKKRFGSKVEHHLERMLKINIKRKLLEKDEEGEK